MPSTSCCADIADRCNQHDRCHAPQSPFPGSSSGRWKFVTLFAIGVALYRWHRTRDDEWVTLFRQPVLVALAFHALAQQLAGAAYGFRLFAGALLGRLLVVPAQLHLAENPLALHLLLQRAQGLIDIVVTNQNLHGFSLLL